MVQDVSQDDPREQRLRTIALSLALELEGSLETDPITTRECADAMHMFETTKRDRDQLRAAAETVEAATVAAIADWIDQRRADISNAGHLALHAVSYKLRSGTWKETP